MTWPEPPAETDEMEVEVASSPKSVRNRALVAVEPQRKPRERTIVAKMVKQLDESEQVVVVVVVEWLYYSKRIIIVRWADLSDFFR